MCLPQLTILSQQNEAMHPNILSLKRQHRGITVSLTRQRIKAEDVCYKKKGKKIVAETLS